MRRRFYFWTGLLVLVLAGVGLLWASPGSGGTDRTREIGPDGHWATLENMPDSHVDPLSYEDWKTDFNLRARGITPPLRRPDEALDLSVGNGYVNVQLDQNSGEFTEGGKPNGSGAVPSTPDNCSNYWYLMYQYAYVPSTSWIMFKVDGFAENRTQEAGLGDANTVWRTGDTLFAEWNNYHGVRIRLHLHTVRLGPGPGDNEQVMFKVTGWPADGACHDFGCVQHYDTELGCCGASDCYDGAPISTSFGYVGTSERFYAPGIPTIWRAYLRNPPPGASIMNALGILTGFQAVTPDVFWYGPWPNAVGYPWDHNLWAVGTSFMNDTATLVKWFQRHICPGDSVSFVTYYGIGDLTATPGIAITHSPPVFTGGCSGITPNPTALTFILSNNGTGTANNVSATLTMSCPGIGVTGPNPQTWPSLAGYGGSVSANWTITLTSPPPGPCNYTLSVNWSGGSTSQSYTLNIPGSGGSISATASASPPDICIGGCSQLQATPTGGTAPFNFSWSPTTGLSNPTIANPQACPAATTNYTCNISDANTCTGVANVTVNVHPIPTIAAVGDTVCFRTQGTLTASSSGSGGNFTWMPGPLTGPAVNPPDPGNYTVYYIDSWGCQSPSVTVPYFVDPELVVEAGPDQTVCQGAFVTLGGAPTATGGSMPYIYSWSPPTGLSDATAANPTLIAASTQTYFLTVTDPITCVATDQVQVIVNDTVTTFSLESPPDGDTLSQGTFDLRWYAALGAYPVLYDVYVDGVLYASDLTGTSTPYTLNCYENHTWYVIAHNQCNQQTSPTWSFLALDCVPPIAEIVHTTPGYYTSCNPPAIAISLVDNRNAIDPATIDLWVNGVPYPYPDAHWTYDGAFITFIPDPPFADGTLIEVELRDAADSAQNHISPPLRWTFTVDWSPPIIDNIVPPPGTTVAVRYPTITFDLEDLYSGLDQNNSWISIITNSGYADTFFVTDPWLRWSDPHMRIDGTDIGLNVSGGDTIEVCVHAIDQVDTCGVNVLDTCWRFDIALGGPVGEVIRPFLGAVTNCELQEITLTLADSNGVDPLTIVFEVNGTPYTIGGNLFYNPDTLRFVPSSRWADGDTVRFCLTEANDSLGNAMAGDVCGYFLVDLSAPIIYNIFPPPADLSNDSFRVIRFDVIDSVHLVDTSQLYVLVNGATVRFGDPGVTLTSEIDSLGYVIWHWQLDPRLIPQRWDDDDTVTFCVHAQDRPDTTYCLPNIGEHCQTFFIHLPGPVQTVLFPFDGAWVACADTGLRILIVDTLGVNWSSVQLEAAGSTYTADSAQISHRGDTLIFIPNPPFVHGQVVSVNLLAANDILGNVLMNPIAWTFRVDLESPQPISFNPGCGMVVSTIQPRLSWVLQDLESGIAPDSVAVRIGITLYRAGDPGFTWFPIGDSVVWDAVAAGVSFSGGEVVTACVLADDRPDFCPPNHLDSCCTFSIARGGPIATEIRPTNSIISACVGQNVTLTLVDPQGDPIPPATIVLRVNGTPYHVDGTTLAFTPPNLVFTPSPAFGPRELVTVCIDSAEDNLRNTLDNPHCWTFQMDLESPVTWGYTPAPSAVVATRTPIISAFIADSVSGLNPDSIYFTIDGAPFWLRDGDFTYNAATGLCTFTPTAHGLAWNGGDSIRVCLGGADRPTATYCPPNHGEGCWVFHIQTGGPTATEVRPTDGIYSACDTQAVTLTVADSNGIIPSSIWIRVNGVPHQVGTPGTSYAGTTVTYTPTPGFLDGSLVTVCVDSALDSLMNPLDNPHCWDFTMDFTPPLLSGANPDDGVIYVGTRPIITFTLSDLTSGVDPSTVTININGLRDWTVTDLPVAYDAGTGLWTFTCADAGAGYRFRGGDVVTICVNAGDSPTTTYCAPNMLDTCWSFTIQAGGPEGTIIFPRRNHWVSCPDSVILMEVTADNGVVPSSILLSVATHRARTVVDSNGYLVDGVRLFWTDPNLRYVPDPYWQDGDTIYVMLLQAQDTLANPLSAVVSWWFAMDMSPAVMSNPLPSPGTAPADLTPTISFDLLDALSGVNEATSTVTLTASNGYSRTLGLTEAPGSWTPATNHWSVDVGALGADLHGGDSVEVCVHAPDSPDDCAPNVLDTCWEFSIAVGGPDAAIVHPDSNTIDACLGDSVIINLDDPDGVDTTTIRLEVDGVIYTIGDAQLYYTRPMLIYVPNPAFVNEANVHVRLIAADDVLGNALETPLDWTFTMDLEGPRVLTTWPPNDTVFADWHDRPQIRVQLQDNLLPTAGSSVRVDVTGLFTLGTRTLSTALTCITWQDTLPRGGGFTFAPAGYPLSYPAPDGLTDGAWYPELVPITVTVSAATDSAADYCGPNPIFAPVTWTFMIADDDVLPPDQFHGGPDLVNWNSTVTVQARLSDPSGIHQEPGSRLGVYAIWGTNLTTLATSTDTLWLLFDSADIFGAALTLPTDFTGWIYYRVSATDDDFDFRRAADRLTSTRDDSFLVEQGATASLVLPPQDAITSCADQLIRWQINSSRDIDPATITVEVNDVAMGIGPEVTYAAADKTVTYDPATAVFVNNGTVTAALTAATDVDGNPLVTGVRWTFRTDVEAPQITFREPTGIEEDPSGRVMLRDYKPTIRIEITDNLAGVDPASITFTIKNVAYDLSSPGLSYADNMFVFQPEQALVSFTPGDTIEVCLDVSDSPIQGPEYCAPNRGHKCWKFNIEPAVKCATRPDPFSPNNDGINDRTLFEYPNLFTEQATISIFTVRNVLVWQAKGIGPFTPTSDIGIRMWDGNDDAGKQVKPGVYLYVIEVSGSVVCKGTVTVAR